MKLFHRLILTYLFLSFFSTSLYAQKINSIQGIIVDTSKDSSIIDFVSIGIIGKNVGTISDATGVFKLSIPDQNFNDSITFSKIGYYPKLFKSGDLIKNKNIRIMLVPKITELEEVIVRSKGLKTKIRGNITRVSWAVAPINATALGGEFGTVIQLPKEQVFVKDFNFHITANYPDSAKFRLNIYAYDLQIGENLLKENIYFTIPGKYIGDFKVDLTKYNLSFINDIFISVEPIAIYSKGPNQSKTNDKFYDRINISIALKGDGAFSRDISLGIWKKLKGSFAPGFWITYKQ
jgi:hypothetical protein